jgi:trimeric autotransporter adhesin
MSTKTTFKRIALVAVAALMGGLLSVTATPAANAATGTMTIGTPTAGLAVVGDTVTVSIPVTLSATTISTDTFAVSANIAAKPTGSVRALNTATTVTGTGTEAGGIIVANSTPTARFTCSIAQTLSGVGTTANAALLTASVGTCTAATSRTLTYAFVPDVAGTYTIQVFADGVFAAAGPTPVDGVLNGSEVARTISITATENPAATTVLAQPIAGVGLTTAGSNGAAGLWVRLSFLNSAGTASRLGTGQQAVLTIPTGLTLQRVNATTVSATASDYGINNTAVSTAGVVWLNFVSSTAGTYAVSAKVGSGTATTLALQYAAATDIAVTSAAFGKAGSSTTTALNFNNTTGLNTSASAGTVVTTASAATYNVFGTTASGVVAVRIRDTSGLLLGYTGNVTQDIAVTTGAVGATADTIGLAKTTGSFTLPSVAISVNPFDGTARGYSLNAQPTNVTTDIGTSTLTYAVTGVAAAADAWVVTPASTVSVVNGGTITFIAECDDTYGAAMAGRAVTAQITAGRNVQALSTALITDAAGQISFTVTDAAPTSATLTDTVTFAGCGSTNATVTINYVASLSATTLTMSPVTTSTAPASAAISTSSATAWDGSRTVTATALDAAGIAVVGLPVTLTLPAGVTFRSTSTAVAYTNALGVASWRLGTKTAGTYKLTAAGGGLSRDVFLQFTGGTARVVSVTAGTAANGAVPVTVKVADAYGNGVSGASVTITGTGSGYFQGIALSSTQTTTADGTVVAAWIGSGTVTAVISGGQSADAAALIGTTAAAGFPAGVGTASLAVDGGTSSADLASDAAAEATDAANAATDAANAAAEAADAATAAAQDAADAVAALSASVSEMVSALKKQITSLTNLVIKIQKKVRA